MFRDPSKIINLLASVFYDPRTYYTIKVLQFLKFYYHAKDSIQDPLGGSTQYLITS